jgi:hypothetical protein
MKLKALCNITLPAEKKDGPRIKVKNGEVFECSDDTAKDLLSMKAATKKVGKDSDK